MSSTGARHREVRRQDGGCRSKWWPDENSGGITGAVGVVVLLVALVQGVSDALTGDCSEELHTEAMVLMIAHIYYFPTYI